MTDTNFLPPGQPPPAGERRLFPRLPAAPRARAYLHLHGGRAVGPLPVRDHSAGGLCLVLPAPVPRRSVSAVGLYDRAAGAWVTLPARGVCLRPGPAGECLLAVAFEPGLTEAQRQALLP